MRDASDIVREWIKRSATSSVHSGLIVDLFPFRLRSGKPVKLTVPIEPCYLAVEKVAES